MFLVAAASEPGCTLRKSRSLTLHSIGCLHAISLEHCANSAPLPVRKCLDILQRLRDFHCTYGTGLPWNPLTAAANAQ